MIADFEVTDALNLKIRQFSHKVRVNVPLSILLILLNYLCYKLTASQYFVFIVFVKIVAGDRSFNYILSVRKHYLCCE